VCDPTLEIFDELHQSNPVNPVEDLPGTLKISTTVSHWLDSLIGQSGLVLVVFHLRAVPVNVGLLLVGLEKS
jgi:hypothetical protein